MHVKELDVQILSVEEEKDELSILSVLYTGC